MVVIYGYLWPLSVDVCGRYLWLLSMVVICGYLDVIYGGRTCASYMLDLVPVRRTFKYVSTVSKNMWNRPTSCMMYVCVTYHNFIWFIKSVFGGVRRNSVGMATFPKVFLCIQFQSDVLFVLI
jgi:hypothetical protein